MKSRGRTVPDGNFNGVSVPENEENFIGNSKNKYTELEWYAKTLDNGKQLWASVRNGKVENCGINKEARLFDKETGLCRNTPQKKKK